MLSPSTTSALRRNLGPTMFALTFVHILSFVTMQSAAAQTYTVLHNFTGGNDGGVPIAGLTLDRAGNLYGTADQGGNHTFCTPGCGTVYQLKHAGSGWILNTLYAFHGNDTISPDGAFPSAAVVFGPDGSLYGSTGSGGTGCFGSCGTVFKLRPPPVQCHSVVCSWRVTTLYNFQGPLNDGTNSGNIIFDHAGNIYGTGGGGGNFCDDLPYCGVLFELSPSNGSWLETILVNFWSAQYPPSSSLTLDNAGNLYGTTTDGGTGGGGGTVFEVTPSGPNSQLQVLYSFGFDVGFWPVGGVIFDTAGNLYGSTAAGGTGNGGTVFQLVPDAGSWSLNVLYNFTNPGRFDTFGPHASLTMDAAGNLYGTTYADGANQCGSVFKLTHSNGSWTYTSLHDFTCGSDGAHPEGAVVLDSAGNLYGTASAGGSQNKGVVFEITP
jgi:uncharacterized repeat protein (TIGR03803 family)